MYVATRFVVSSVLCALNLGIFLLKGFDRLLISVSIFVAMYLAVALVFCPNGDDKHTVDEVVSVAAW